MGCKLNSLLSKRLKDIVLSKMRKCILAKLLYKRDAMTHLMNTLV